MQSVKYFDVKGRRTRVLVAGDANGHPILLLHGIGRSLEDWEPQFSRYRHAGYRVVALDLPGSGFSDRLHTSTTLCGLAQSVVETLDVIGEPGRLHVMGNSLGGAVGLRLLTLDPDRVATLVLADSGGFGSELHPVLRLIATPVLGSLATRYITRAGARMIERLLYVDRSLVTDERIDRALTFARRSGNRVVLHETARSLSTFRGVRSEWRDELMADVSKHLRPTLIAWGDSDRILPAKQTEAAHRLLPHARVRLFKGVGHMPQVESAEKFADLTLDFLRSHAGA
jgi:pimeloyl-ACP methyl ester carboxylesterase